MIIYNERSMIHPDHIEMIDQQLQKYGSKVSGDFLNSDKAHALGNVLSLALGEGSYRVDLADINAIGNHEFSTSFDSVC